jgi:prepilin-type N-terminal cleavage/methylation domain-containing protein/prepilin-type processing-associated H-X9-DG protein
MKFNRKSHGFTLVELLVVIGIIAVLVSILLPALSRARQQAMLINCQSNLKQIAAGFHLYATNNKQTFPPLNMSMTTVQDLGGGNLYPPGYGPVGSACSAAQKNEWYTNRLSVYLPVTGWKNPANASAMAAGAPDFSSKVWVCPAMPEQLWRNTGGGGYGVAENIIRYYPKGGAYNPAKVRRSASVYLIGDVWFATNTTQPFCGWLYTIPSTKLNPYTGLTWEVSPGIGTPARRHMNNLVNVAFYDGHASAVPWVDLRDNVDRVFSP